MKAFLVAWLWRVLIAFDRFANVVTFGKPNQTISSRAALARNNKRYWGCLLCWLLEKLDPNHCDEALKTDEADAEQVIRSEK